MRSGDILQLQRALGNRATRRLLEESGAGVGRRHLPVQAKMQVGPAQDRYEQEADRVARTVVQRTSRSSGVLESPPSSLLQMKPLVDSISRLQRDSLDEEEEIQAQRFVQRDDLDEEEELQAQRFVQRDDLDEDELQTKRLVLQRQIGPEGGDVDGGLERTIRRERGGGRPLDAPVRRSMENAFGADFSRVRVHTDAASHALNDTLQARAFTTGQDVFFRRDAFNPSSSAGRELLAHELTHVVQQNGPAVRRSPAQWPGRRAFRRPTNGIFAQTMGRQSHAIYAQRCAFAQRQDLVQRDDEEGVVSKAINLGDIGGAIVEVYEAYAGDDSANTIVKAVTDLAGGLADTTGGVGDVAEGTTSGLGVGSTAKVVGGATNVVAKGSGLFSTLLDYGKSVLDYARSWGYSSSYLKKSADAVEWLGGWAKSAADLISPYAFYTDLVASGSKAVDGVTSGWNAGYALEDLDQLVRSGSTRDVKRAAELLFNLAWWKRAEGYAQSAVGALEGSAAIFLSPLSKGLTAVATKVYESGWASYILRAIGSTFTSAVYSNAQVKQQADQDTQALQETIAPLVSRGKIKDLVALCKAAIDLGMGDFAQAVVDEFNNPPSGKEARYRSRKYALQQQAIAAGFAGKLRFV